jgi:broad specificity phosphatase PhoE
MSKTVTFYYVRHGATLFNRLGRMQGRCDSPLVEEGIAQACEAKEKLKDIPFTRAYTSTSERCIDTAHIILEGRDVPLTYTKDLKEMSWGNFEGARDEEYPEEIRRRRFGDADWSDAGGENLKMLKERVLRCYGKIYEECEDGDIVLIVSHGAIFMHMMHMVFGLNRNYMYQLMREHNETQHPVSHGFAAVFRMTDGRFELLQLNGHYEGFLEDLKDYQE